MDCLLEASIRSLLTPDLVKSEYQGEHPMAGHCYVASEAYYHLVGGKPMNMRHEGVSHWFILDGDRIVDLTVDQFKTEPDYSQARGRGFLTKQPSKRCQIVLDRLAHS